MTSTLATILFLSAVIQLVAALVALQKIRYSGRFRAAWIAISAALFLMIGRRLFPLFDDGTELAHIDMIYALLGLGISMLMLLGVIGLKRLFHQLHVQELELKEQASHDFLTGLYNRRFFSERVCAELARATRYHSDYSLLMLDIDFFKRVNDTHGHHVGDLVLQHIARLTRDSVRAVDTVGRIGGEEFAIFMPETPLTQARDAAERLRCLIGDSALDVAGLPAPIRVTVSIGVATGRNGDSNLPRLLELSDAALYAAKHQGRNRVVCHGDEPSASLAG